MGKSTKKTSNDIDSLAYAIEKVYEKYDEGDMTKREAIKRMKNLCELFIKGVCV